LLEVLPLQGTLALDVATAVLAVAPLLLVHVPQPARSRSALADSSVLTDMRDGFRYVWRWSGLMGMIVLALVVKLALTPAFSLVPLLVTQHFGGAASELALLEALGGAGMIVGGIALGVWGGFRRKILTAMLGVVLLGLGQLVLGMAPANSFWLALGSYVLIGLVIPLIDGSTMAIVQGAVAPDMQGRVLTTMVSLLSISSPIGLAVAGPVADWLGLQSWYLLGGCLCIGAGVCGSIIPAIVNIEENANGAAPVSAPQVAGKAEA
jgi:DHA3 family macrolide efflux protein-like MFS transporter